jgi:cytochrome c-type biogenesis protein CcmE
LLVLSFLHSLMVKVFNSKFQLFDTKGQINDVQSDKEHRLIVCLFVRSFVCLFVCLFVYKTSSKVTFFSDDFFVHWNKFETISTECKHRV